MKKLLLSTFVLFVTIISASAQCTPAVVGNAGVYPDSATNFNHAFRNQPYEQIITIKVPQDTSAAGQTIVFDHFKLDQLTGLPTGLSYACSPSNCEFPAGTSSCAVITGTTADPVGIYPLVIKVTPYILLGPLPIAYTQTTVSYYNIVVDPDNTGILDGLSSNKFSLTQASPNPSNDKSTFYYNLTSRGEVQIKILNALGKEVQNVRVIGNNGANQFVINTADLASGIYLYSLNNGTNTITKRFIVNH
jgi:hypothetical protein